MLNKILIALLLVFLTCTPAFGGVDLDGGDDCLYSAASIDYQTSVITICFWANPDDNGDDVIFESSTNYNTNDGTFLIDPNITTGGGSCMGDFAAGIQDSSGGNLYRLECLSDDPATDAWTHYCIVLDNSTSSGDVKIYVNGIEQATDTEIDNKDQSGDFHDQTLYIGTRGCPGATAPYNGTLDEIYIFDGELTATEVKIVANSRVKRVGLQIDNNLIFYLPLDECKDGTSCSIASMFKDLSGNGRNFTPGNNPTGKGQEVLSYP